MTIRRWTTAVAASVVLVAGFPVAAAASDSDDCAEHGGLVGLSLDECGLRASLLGVEVGVGGSTSDSGEPAPEPAEPAPTDPDGEPGAESDPQPAGSASNQSDVPSYSTASSAPSERSAAELPADTDGEAQPGTAGSGQTTAAGSVARLHSAADGAAASTAGENATEPIAAGQRRGPLADLPGAAGLLGGVAGPVGWAVLSFVVIAMLMGTAGRVRMLRQRRAAGSI